MSYITKEKLYSCVHRLKAMQFFDPDCYGIDAVSYVSFIGVSIMELPFKTKGLRGMAVPGEKGQPDIILLNKWRTEHEQNVDCTHEIMHLSFHSNMRKKTFNCFEKITANQDPFIEWQANEGAAEYLVPYRVFVPMVCEQYSELSGYNIFMFQSYCREMGDVFRVPPTVIDYRLRNLRYEIYQHMNGRSIDEIELASNRELERRKIHVQSIPDIVIENQTLEDDEFAKLWD